jgi:26S proteasome regulatory subunit N2
LEPLLSAKENFVRQGAVIALSFILTQQTEAGCPKVADFRKTVTKMIVEKGEDSITKVSICLKRIKKTISFSLELFSRRVFWTLVDAT